jgi:RNA polymerase sigma factor (sigma-70 family)
MSVYSPADQPAAVRASDHVGLVFRVAHKYRGAGRRLGLTVDDLAGESTFGLLRAVECHDRARGAAFSTLATLYVEYAILTALKRRCHRPWLQLPADPETGEQLDPEDVRGEAPEAGAREGDERATVRRLLRTLHPRQRLVVELRFGLDGTGERTLGEVAAVLKTSGERVRQIEEAALKRLRGPGPRSAACSCGVSGTNSQSKKRAAALTDPAVTTGSP